MSTYAFMDFAVGQAAVIAAIAQSSCCQVYVECGIYDGETLDVVRKVVPRAIGVDTVDRRRQKDSEFFLGTTDQFFASLPEGFKADIVFIDADHNAVAVRRDLANALRILSPYGMIFLHDTDPTRSNWATPGYCGDAYKVITDLLCHEELTVVTMPIGKPGLSLVMRKNDRRVNTWLTATPPTGYSILMPYHHRPEQLHNTLLSYRHWYGNRKNYEVVIIEDVDSAANAEWHAALLSTVAAFPDIQISITQAGKKGIASMHNQAAKLAKYDYLVLSGPEILHYSNVLERLDARLTANPDTYVVGSCFRAHHPGKLTEFNKSRFPLHSWIQHSRHMNRQLHFCSCLRKSLYMQMGGFFPGFDAGVAFEDDDFVEQVKRAGIFILSDDSIETTHQAHPVVPSAVPDGWARNKALFNQRQADRKAGKL